MDRDESPGLIGFSLAFYKTCWEVIQRDLMSVLNDIFERCLLDRVSDISYIALIPKEGVECISDFRPVSLVGSTYKIISKCLALRFKEVLPGVVLREQGAFLQGRTMVDGVLCTN